MCRAYTIMATISAANGQVMIVAASSTTSTSSGAIALGGTFTVFSDSVGMRLISSAAMASVHTATTGPLDHQPGSNCCSSISGSRASSAPGGAGTPTKNSLVNGGFSVSSSS